MPNKIRCSRCGCVLLIKDNINIAKMQGVNVKCKNCNNVAPFSSYTILPQQMQNEPNTNYGNAQGVENDDNSVVGNAPKTSTPGRLVIPSLNLVFNLKIGKNIIGRKAQSSSANFQIPCQERLMSRDHILIEVKKDETKGYKHILSLNKEHSNPTFINGNRLEYGEKIILCNDNIIKMPYTEAGRLEIRFEIPDPEKTDIN